MVQSAGTDLPVYETRQNVILLIYDACGTVCQRAAADKSLG